MPWAVTGYGTRCRTDRYGSSAVIFTHWCAICLYNAHYASIWRVQRSAELAVFRISWEVEQVEAARSSVVSE
jgi:hypothetical protein